MIRLVAWIAFIAGVLVGALRVDLHDAEPPAGTVFEAVRLAVIAMAAYLLAATALAVRPSHFSRLAPPSLRRFVRTALVAGVVSAPSPVWADTPPSEPPVMRRVPAAVATIEPATPAAPPPATTTWVVERGQSFWSIAEHLAGQAAGRPPTVAEVDPVWRRLLARNAGRFADPNLIHPGDRIDIPHDQWQAGHRGEHE